MNLVSEREGSETQIKMKRIELDSMRSAIKGARDCDLATKIFDVLSDWLRLCLPYLEGSDGH